MTHSRLMSAAILGIMLVLAGCGTIIVRQNIDQDGRTTGVMDLKVNLTTIYIKQGAPSSMYTQLDTQMQETICANVSSTMNLTDIACRVTNGVLTLTGSMPNETLNESMGFVKKQGLVHIEYVYTPNMSGMGGGADPSEFLAMMTAQQANMTYIIDVPGRIMSVKGGALVHNLGGLLDEASFDLLRVLSRGTHISVTSVDIGGPLLRLLGWLFLLGIFGLPILRPIIHIRTEKAIYKDKAGTIIYIINSFVLMTLFFIAVISYFYSDSQLMMAFAAMCTLMAFLIGSIGYIGADFRLTSQGIEYKTCFMKTSIPYSRIKKAERAKLRFGLGGLTITTTSGASIKPTHVETRPGRFGLKGVYVLLKDGRSLYYPVKDIGWVIETIKERT